MIQNRKEVIKVIAREFGKKDVGQLSQELGIKKSYIHYATKKLKDTGWKFPNVV